MKNDNFDKYKEKSEHGNVFFPFVIYNNLMPDYFISFPIHWHEEIEIIYVLDGKGTYNVNYESMTLEKGDILFISPSILHGFSQYHDSCFKSKVILFNLNIIKSSIDICENKYFLPLLKNKCTPYVHINTTHPSYSLLKNELISTINSHNTHNDFYELEIKSKLLNLIYCLFSNDIIKIYNTQKNHKDTELIKMIITYLKDNYQNNITLQMLSEQFKLSPYYISHIFKNATNMSCIDFLIDYRLNVASTLLKETDNSILSIALDTGFNNISYFNRAFKKTFHTTPKNYRMQDK